MRDDPMPDYIWLQHYLDEILVSKEEVKFTVRGGEMITLPPWTIIQRNGKKVFRTAGAVKGGGLPSIYHLVSTNEPLDKFWVPLLEQEKFDEFKALKSQLCNKEVKFWTKRNYGQYVILTDLRPEKEWPIFYQSLFTTLPHEVSYEMLKNRFPNVPSYYFHTWGNSGLKDEKEFKPYFRTLPQSS